jgi:hypothetical protein
MNIKKIYYESIHYCILLCIKLVQVSVVTFIQILLLLLAWTLLIVYIHLNFFDNCPTGHASDVLFFLNHSDSCMTVSKSVVFMPVCDPWKLNKMNEWMNVILKYVSGMCSDHKFLLWWYYSWNKMDNLMFFLAYFSSVKKEGANVLLHTTREEHCVCMCVSLRARVGMCITCMLLYIKLVTACLVNYFSKTIYLQHMMA